jgi:hypothetical protein
MPNTGPDSEDHDSDNDGLEDYPWGNDTVLIQPQNGKIKYLGVVPKIPKLPVITGEDVTYFFIDTDNDVSTGYYVNQFNGADLMINISGKGNQISSKYLCRFNSNNPKEWNWIQIAEISAAIDSHALEAQIGFSTLGILQNNTFSVWFLTTDWRNSFDQSDFGINETRGERGTRAPGSKVVLNEIYPGPNDWIELYNTGNRDVDISGWVITWDTGSFTVPTGTTIPSGGFSVFDLANIPASSTVTLFNDKNQQLDTTTYTSVPSGQGWGRYPDGVDNWIYTNPTKGGPNQPVTPPPPADVIINEIYPDAANGWVELYNNGDRNQDIGGWYIVWSGGTYVIPGNTRIQKAAFLAFDLGNIPATDTVTLFNDIDVQQDSVSFTNVGPGYGWGRYPDGSGSWWTTLPTRAAPNIIPEFSDIMVPIMIMVLIVIFRWSKKDAKLFKRRKSSKIQS